MLRHVLSAFCNFLALSCLVLSAVVVADEPVVRETPLSPEEELKTFRLADERLSVELVANEPQLDSPVAISWDGDGRMYVAEMIDYPVGPTAGRIRLLEDRDHDGRYEHATVFASGLKFPNGVLACRDGVLVTAAPEILFLRDTNGDGVADEKKVLFTGFGEGNQQLRANGLTWGLDNWVYGANGRSDGEIRRPSDPPTTPAVSIRGRDFRFRPDGSRFEATTGGSQFGQSSDDWGNRFISWNTIPIRHALFEQSFVEGHPRLAALAVRDIADPNDSGQVFPISPRPLTFNRERTDYFNALCGLTIFRGDALGRDYMGSAFLGESLTSLVHRRVLTAEGPTFISRRGEHDREFLASTDSWFHPVYMATGPDGALYVVDFYRRWVEHPAFVPEASRAKVDWQQGKGHGRIWKVSRRENTWPPREQPKMSKQSLAELVKQLESPNGWRRDTAQRLLVERNDPQAAPLLRSIVAESKLPQAKLHALGVLESLNLLDDGLLLRGFEDGDPHVRQFAMRLAAPRVPKSAPLREALLTMADFPSPLVRFQVTLALADVDGPEKVAALVKLAHLESRDPVIPLAMIGSLGGSAGDFLLQLVKAHPEWRTKPSVDQMRLLREAAASVAARGDTQQLATGFEALVPKGSAIGPGDLAMLTGITQGLTERGNSLRAWLSKPPKGLKPHLPTLEAMLAGARTLALDEDESIDHRLVAIELLGLLDAQSGPPLLTLIDARHEQRLQSAAAAALVQADPTTAEKMFESWPNLTLATRRAVVAAALRSPGSIAALVRELESERIQPRELDPATRDGLLAVRDPALEPRIQSLLKSPAAGPNRQEVVTRFTPALEAQGDRTQGAKLFEKHCLVCHSVQSRGNRVGPDLSGVGARPKETLLVDIFDPSRQVNPEYVAYTLLTREGQVLTGIVASETAASITLRRAEGAQDFVPRGNIEELRATGKSLMPDGMEENLSEADVANLLAFLSQPDARLFSKPK